MNLSTRNYQKKSSKSLFFPNNLPQIKNKLREKFISKYSQNKSNKKFMISKIVDNFFRKGKANKNLFSSLERILTENSKKKIFPKKIIK